MEYCAGADAPISSTEFIILGSIRFAGNFNTKIKLYVIDIASVALMRGASAPHFFGDADFSQGELIVIGRQFCWVKEPI
jgi:hypothetical protein